jgi:hypothetical protein
MRRFESFAPKDGSMQKVLFSAADAEDPESPLACEGFPGTTGDPSPLADSAKAKDVSAHNAGITERAAFMLILSSLIQQN